MLKILGLKFIQRRGRWLDFSGIKLNSKNKKRKFRKIASNPSKCRIFQTGLGRKRVSEYAKCKQCFDSTSKYPYRKKYGLIKSSIFTKKINFICIKNRIKIMNLILSQSHEERCFLSSQKLSWKSGILCSCFGLLENKILYYKKYNISKIPDSHDNFWTKKLVFISFMGKF